ncbi:MAG: hypothetical protein H0T51_26885 [Pirellulales bacterium]|nr:hypothetical protein [Pirellulales bacterium]
MRSSYSIAVVLFLIAALHQGQPAPAANVLWTSSTDGLYQTPSNWSSSPLLPSFADDVSIDQPGALTVTLSSGSQSIRQLTSEENLVISSAAELLVGAGGGTIDGALTITNGRLTSQAGGTLTVNGAVNSTVVGLRALSGGTLNLPTLAMINAPSSPVARYDAQGALSKLDLSAVTNFSGGDSTSPTTVAAFNGGRVELENVSALTSGATLVVSDGPDSVVDLSALTHITSDNQFIRARLDAINGGTVLTPNLATIGRATVEVRGAASSLNLQALTNADGASFTARVGGQIAPPLLTSYAAGLGFTEFFANGTNSLIDLSELTTFSGATFSSMVISANDGATIDLSGVTSISSGAINLVAGVGGLIDLSSLQSYTATNMLQTRRFRAEKLSGYCRW